jgi:hypothetical protein
MRVAAGEAMATVVSARVASLTQGGLSMLTNGWKTTAVAVFTLATVASLAGGVGAGHDRQATPASSAVTASVAQPPPVDLGQDVKPPVPAAMNDREAAQENWPMTLSEATRIAMDNSGLVRVIAFSAQNSPAGGLAPQPLDGAGEDRQERSARMTIRPIQPNSSVWRFKSRITAELRSVEQEYWNLSQAHVQLWGAEQAVRLAKEILDREQTELEAGRGTVADTAEAAQRLEQFNLDLTTRTSDVSTTERLLRKMLGLPLADYRQIVPVTKPTEALIEPIWDTCLGEMMDQQPEIVFNKLATAEVPVPGAALPESMTRQSAKVKDELGENQRQHWQQRMKQAIQQRTHNLARFFLEIDSNYKQYQTAKRLRTAASKRLDVQRAYYEEGRITVDRLLDAVGQYYGNAVATEAQYKTSYNVAISGLQEAKGTLLADRGITVVEGPLNSIADDRGNTQPVPGAFEAPTGVPIPVTRADPSSSARPFVPEKTETDATSHKAASEPKSTPKVWSFSLSIGRERPFLIKGTISEGTNDRPGAIDQ